MNEKTLNVLERQRSSLALKEESSFPAKNELGEIRKGINKAIERYGDDPE